MIEKISHKKKLLALIIRGKYRKMKGVNFFTPNNSTQQFGYIRHKKKHIIKPHMHNKRMTKIFYTTEVLLLLKGILRVDFYGLSKKYLFSKILKKNDIIMLVHGGHGFKALKEIEMLEIKQGPYSLSKDKKLIENIDENKIRIK